MWSKRFFRVRETDLLMSGSRLGVRPIRTRQEGTKSNWFHLTNWRFDFRCTPPFASQTEPLEAWKCFRNQFDWVSFLPLFDCCSLFFLFFFFWLTHNTMLCCVHYLVNVNASLSALLTLNVSPFYYNLAGRKEMVCFLFFLFKLYRLVRLKEGEFTKCVMENIFLPTTP